MYVPSATAGNDIRVGENTGDIALALLAELLGPVEVVAIGLPDSPLPVTGHCSRCGSSTTVYGAAGRPLCDQCRESRAPRPAKTGEDAERPEPPRRNPAASWAASAYPPPSQPPGAHQGT